MRAGGRYQLTYHAPAKKCPNRAAAMCWRQVSKFQKTVQIVLFYLVMYLLISYVMMPETTLTFVNDELRVGDKYSLIFLVAPRTPVFSDAEGADVFKTRRCGRCFVTNNKGFLPMSVYDAVLIFDGRPETAFIDPDKRYLIETSKNCVRNKLRRCSWEPKITSFATKETFDLCGLCEQLVKKRLKV